MLRLGVFQVGDDLPEDIEPLSVIPEPQISCFADQPGFEGLLNHLGLARDLHGCRQQLWQGQSAAAVREMDRRRQRRVQGHRGADDEL